ncbi:hypothetical protein B0H34DRAFT_69883 [Crassisporium funariophilum]|nr:hypothetical protein B0H34DRAFT_69883 [Crassisporium funariophilum]
MPERLLSCISAQKTRGRPYRQPLYAPRQLYCERTGRSPSFLPRGFRSRVRYQTKFGTSVPKLYHPPYSNSKGAAGVSQWGITIVLQIGIGRKQTGGLLRRGREKTTQEGCPKRLGGRLRSTGLRDTTLSREKEMRRKDERWRREEGLKRRWLKGCGLSREKEIADMPGKRRKCERWRRGDGLKSKGL